MYWSCDICDKIIFEQFKDNHLQSRYHKRLAKSVIKKNINTNPTPNKFDDTIRKYVILHYRK